MFKNILVPIDLSNDDKINRAVNLAKEMIKSDETKITLMTVLPQIPGYILSELPAEHAQKVTSDTQSKMQDIAQNAGFTSPVTTKISHGNPYNEILNVAQQDGIDLIIMSSHQPVWEDYLFGSVAAEVVRHAKCSVLVER